MRMRKTIIAAVAAVALGASNAAMAAHGGGGGGGHMGGGGGHIGGGFGGGHFGGGHFGGGLGAGHFGAGPGIGHVGGINSGLAPRVGIASGGVAAAPRTFSGIHGNLDAGHAYAFRGDHDHHRGHRRFVFVPGLGGLYDYDGCDNNWPYYSYQYGSCYGADWSD